MKEKPTYKKLEQDLKELKEEAIDQMQIEKALKESSERIKFFAYSISHDLKSPAIGLYALTKRLQKDYSDILDERSYLLYFNSKESSLRKRIWSYMAIG